MDSSIGKRVHDYFGNTPSKNPGIVNSLLGFERSPRICLSEKQFSPRLECNDYVMTREASEAEVHHFLHVVGEECLKSHWSCDRGDWSYTCDAA